MPKPLKPHPKPSTPSPVVTETAARPAQPVRCTTCGTAVAPGAKCAVDGQVAP